ncbi:glycosyltransferase [Methylobacterium sp. C25]|uniref:glycosyltransferase family 2 protein n=1 Tax=Methylobacterium sp. C25 TaxID=2721622 RepID=UPI001F47C710|nr:glycosyltransferase [Methylobacterium sp. C25]MCE4223314.1 glycosyltransferase [Methylobacterium sp. C25]
MIDRDVLPPQLRFAALPEPGLARIIALLLRHPREARAVAWARLTGKRLRARQRLAALIGADHRLWLSASARPQAESASALATEGIEAVSPGALADHIASDAPLILLLPHGHALVAGAAAAIAKAFREYPALKALYGDALVAREDGALLPILRPAFDPDFLRGLDVVGPVVALRRASLAALCQDLVLGAETLDLLLRIDAGGGEIRHLPRILSSSPLAALAVSGHEARLAAIRADLVRRGEGGVVWIESGIISITRPLPEPRPLVSLIVPTRDRLDLLRPCITSLLERTDWPSKEILVCDNGSREPETLAYLRDLETRGIARTIPCPGPFDFAGMNNRAAEAARGHLLAFVNNDVEAFRPDWLERMVREALRPDIGAVGAKLLDGEGRIQHGGIVLGTGGGLVTHDHRHFSGDAPGYLGALLATHRVSAVTAACLVVEAHKFRAVSGFDAEHFTVDFNDVDLCLRLNAVGWHTLLVPSAILHHREAASRVRSSEAEARHRAEIANLKKRWRPLLAQDPHYHPGFDPNLSTHARLRRGSTGLEPARPR